MFVGVKTFHLLEILHHWCERCFFSIQEGFEEKRLVEETSWQQQIPRRFSFWPSRMTFGWNKHGRVRRIAGYGGGFIFFRRIKIMRFVLFQHDSNSFFFQWAYLTNSKIFLFINLVGQVPSRWYTCWLVRQSKELGSAEVATGDPYVHRSCIQSGELGLEHGPRTRKGGFVGWQINQKDMVNW